MSEEINPLSEDLEAARAEVKVLKKQLAVAESEKRRIRHVHGRLLGGLQSILGKKLATYGMLTAVAEAVGYKRKRNKRGKKSEV